MTWFEALSASILRAKLLAVGHHLDQILSNVPLTLCPRELCMLAVVNLMHQCLKIVMLCQSLFEFVFSIINIIMMH